MGILALCGWKPYLTKVLEDPEMPGIARVSFISPNLGAEGTVRNGYAVPEHGKGVK